MRAIVCNAFGPPENLVLQEVDVPPLSADEVRIKVIAAGVNFPDALMIEGRYQLKPPLPFVPGLELAGEIIEIGAAVKTFKPGDRVMALASRGYGAFAEQAVARAVEIAPIPPGIDDVTAAGFYVVYGTAYHGLVQRAALRAGETVVVLGATGGVGLAAVEIASALGARVIAVGSSQEKLRAAQNKGATELLSYLEGDLGRRVKALTDGKGADICLDTLGGDAFDEMSRAMSWEGRLLVVGFTSGRIPRLPVNLALLKGYQLAGVSWGAFVSRSPQINAVNFEVLAELIKDGRIKPQVAGTYPLEQVAQALNDLTSRRTIGKLVITMSS